MIALVAVAVLAAAPAAPAARIGDEAISVAEVDAAAPAEVAALHDELALAVAELARQALAARASRTGAAPATAVARDAHEAAGAQGKPGRAESGAGGAADEAGGTEDRAGGTEDRAGGTEDRAGGAEDRAGGAGDRAGGAEGQTGGTEVEAGRVEDGAARTEVEAGSAEDGAGGAEQRTGRAQDRAGGAAWIAALPPSLLERPLEDARVVARAGGESVTGAEVERRGALRLYRLRGELARVRKRALGELVEARLLADEARRRGVGVEELIGAPPVSPSDVEAVVEAERSAGRRAPDPARVRPLLEARARHRARTALAERLRREARVEVLLVDPAPPLLAVSAREGPSLGPKAGPTIVLFADYRSAASRQVHRAVDALRARRPDVRVELRDFVAANDGVAAEAARLVRCADRLGGAAAVREELLARPPPEPREPREPWLDDEARGRLALGLGGDVAELEACLASAAVDAAIRADTDEVLALGFEAPPALLVEGRPFAGRQSAETLAAALDRDPSGD